MEWWEGNYSAEFIQTGIKWIQMGIWVSSGGAWWFPYKLYILAVSFSFMSSIYLIELTIDIKASGCRKLHLIWVLMKFKALEFVFNEKSSILKLLL